MVSCKMSGEVYVLPNGSQSEGIYELFTWVNNVSGGIFFPVIVLVIYIITFITLLSYTSPSRAMTFTSFLCAILGMMLSVLGLFSAGYMYLIIISLGAGVFWLSLENAS